MQQQQQQQQQVDQVRRMQQPEEQQRRARRQRQLQLQQQQLLQGGSSSSWAGGWRRLKGAVGRDKREHLPRVEGGGMGGAGSLLALLMHTPSVPMSILLRAARPLPVRVCLVRAVRVAHLRLRPAGAVRQGVAVRALLRAAGSLPAGACCLRKRRAAPQLLVRTHGAPASSLRAWDAASGVGPLLAMPPAPQCQAHLAGAPSCIHHPSPARR